jgi:hypothetical protein
MTVGDADQTLDSDHFTVNSGLTIAYTTNDAGICTIVSQKLHAVGAGTCVVSANQAGNAGWFAAAQVQSGNITISASGGPAINEAFNNVTNFTNVVNTVTASGGLGHGGTEWDWNFAVCNTSLASANHYARATASAIGAADGGGVMARYSDGTHYYYAFVGSGYAQVYRQDGGWDANYNGSYTSGAGVTHDIKLEVTTIDASTVGIKVYVDNMTTPAINATDTTAGRLTTGSQIGVLLKRSTNDEDETVDNLTGDVL